MERRPHHHRRRHAAGICQQEADILRIERETSSALGATVTSGPAAASAFEQKVTKETKVCCRICGGMSPLRLSLFVSFCFNSFGSMSEVNPRRFLSVLLWF